MNNTEFYERLGVSKSASQDEIKKAYRKLSKKYHPDINKEPGAEQTYKDVQEAYETLGDEQKRAAYDQFGAAGANGGGFGGQGGFSGFDGAGFGGFEDIFSSFFGGGGTATRNPNAPRQGDDLQYRLNISFEEAIFGTKKEIKYNREASCHTCHGSGAKPGTSPVTCSRCGGAGMINVDTQTPLGMMRRQVVCDVCHGRGQEIKDPCGTCHGSGRESQAHTVEVKVPEGVDSGQQIRLSGQGEAGHNGGPYGDLFVVIHVAASDKFERDGMTIHYSLHLNFVQAALGDTVDVPTVYGDVELSIPEGTQTGKRFRLRGKGVPSLRGTAQGDQMVTIVVDTPTELNEEQRRALMDFAKAGDIDVKPRKKNFFEKMFDGE